MTSPSILFIGSFLSAHMGTRAVGEELAERFTARGWQVHTTSSKPGRVRRMLDMVWAILSLRDRYQAAYLEVFSGLAFIWADVCARLLKSINKPFILALHGGGLVDFAARHPNRMNGLLSRASLVTTPSRFIQRNLTTASIPVQYIPNGLDLAQYSFRCRKAVSPDLVWLRAFSHIYHPDMAVYALREVAARFPNAHLTMIGPDKKDGSFQGLQAAIQQTGMQAKVIIKGPVAKTEVGSILQSGDIFINTTNFESFGVSVLEAAACGLCIVSTNVGELPYLWQDGADALLVPPDDPGAMAKAVERILTEPGLAEMLSLNARRKAEQYDWSVVLPQWEEVFTRAAQRQK